MLFQRSRWTVMFVSGIPAMVPAVAQQRAGDAAPVGAAQLVRAALAVAAGRLVASVGTVRQPVTEPHRCDALAVCTCELLHGTFWNTVRC